MPNADSGGPGSYNRRSALVSASGQAHGKVGNGPGAGFFGPLSRAPRVAGVATALTVIVTTVICAAALVVSFRSIHPVAGDLMSIFLIYSGIGDA